MVVRVSYDNHAVCLIETSKHTRHTLQVTVIKLRNSLYKVGEVGVAMGTVPIGAPTSLAL